MTGIYLLLGSNLGDREQLLRQARNLLTVHIGPILNQSSLYRTEAWGMEQSPAFLNQILLIQSKASPTEILEQILNIESSLGRVRQRHYVDRTIDIDIIYYNKLVLEQPDLVIPHPRISLRRFVLEPLVEIAPSFVHPVLQVTNSQLLKQCLDPLLVTRL